VTDRVGLPRLLAIEPLRLGRQLGLAVRIEGEDDAVRRQVLLEPGLLGGQERLDLGGVAAVLVRRRKVG
jgi:hypothetical protein